MEAISGTREPRRGFTLVEMLAVVVIIGILAALITAAAVMARARAKRAAIKLEIDQLDLAIVAYKARFGDYPPDFTNQDAVKRHMARAFPKYTGEVPSLPAGNIGPAVALVYWLGGKYDGTKFIGFSADPEDPLDLKDPNNPCPSRIDPFFPFNMDRIKKLPETEELVYYPDIGVPMPSNPYLYFRSRPGGVYEPDAGQIYRSLNKAGGNNLEIIPYRDAVADGWVNPKKFQILCAGLDDVFGEDNTFRDDSGYDAPELQELGGSEYDNITNFSNVTLQDELP